jgi:lactoylglutathione lyase
MDLGDFDAALDVKDIARTAAFYEALGFRKTGGDAEVRTIAMLRGDCRICLYQGNLDPARPQLIFWDGDIDAIAEHVQRQDIALFRGVKRDPEGGAAFMIKDPDENPIFFITMKTHFKDDPKHAKPAEPRPPPLIIDPTLGWFELSLDVKDIARSEDFYARLGFEVVVREAKGTRVSLQNGDCRIGLFRGHLQPPRPQLIFWQGDIDALAETVTSHGLGFVNPPRRDDSGAAFMIEDPDGHPLFFINMRGVTREQPDPSAVAAS